MLLLDTHVLVWLMFENRALGAEARDAIANALRDSSVAVSAMVFWEISMVTSRGRMELYEDVHSWRQKVLRLGIREVAVTGEIAVSAGQLIALHADPADRLIVATGVINGATLMTADRDILSWRSPLRRIDARR